MENSQQQYSFEGFNGSQELLEICKSFVNGGNSVSTLICPNSRERRHLIFAVQNEAEKLGEECLLTTADNISDKLISSLANKNIKLFYEAFEGPKFLIIDTFDFMSGKEMIQGETLKIVKNRLACEKKTLFVFSCDMTGKGVYLDELKKLLDF